MMLIFFAFSAIILAVEGHKCSRGQLTPQHRREIVTQINKFRWQLIHGRLRNKDGVLMPRGKNMLKMQYSCELEYSAQRWADQCKFAHSPRHEREGIGENVYAYWSSASVAKYGKTGGTDAGKDWWDELRTKYTNNPSNVLTYKVPGSSLHFTQMAWGETHKIGCGIATHCDGGKTLIVICHYSPVGNWRNELIYEIGEPCKKNSDCKTNKCSLGSGLCKV